MLRMVKLGKSIKKGIPERKMAKFENPILNAHLHINIKLTNSIYRKSFKRSRRNSDHEAFLMRT